MNGYLATTGFHVDGVVMKDAPEAHYRMISADYFTALGIPVLEGRPFGAADRGGSAPVAIVNETFARHHFGGNAVGRRMRLDDGQTPPREVGVVGVAGNVKHFGLERETVIEVYVPMGQVPDPTTVWLANNMYWVVRTEGAPLAAANAVRREIAAVDPAVPASFVRSMDQWVAGTIAPRRLNLLLVEAFAAAALLLAAVGVYAVAASTVASRAREIGIRTALGASGRSAVGLVVRGSLKPVLAGLAVGMIGALLGWRALSGLLFGVTPGDPVSLGIAVATLAGVALVASYVPARRAASVDPLIALRMD
jgi:putative ABC transport system permease protein